MFHVYILNVEKEEHEEEQGGGRIVVCVELEYLL